MIELVVRFQWVKCQIDALGRCLSLSSLRKALRSLPKDLDDTYARILQSIEDDEHSKLVAMIMQWLAYSERPMSLTEISEALIVDPDDDYQYDVERRFEDPQDLLRICSSLVTTEPWPGSPSTPPVLRKRFKFAHFSVREYLESSRTHDGPNKRYAIQEIRSNTFIAESCIIYLSHLDVSQKRTEDNDDDDESLRKEYPLADYAASNWIVHAERAEESGNIIALSKAFFREVDRLPRWKIGDSKISGLCLNSQGKYLPLLHASCHNVPNIMSAFVLEGADVNAPNKIGWTPWMAISTGERGRIELVQFFLKHGADINARNESGFTAVMIAASNGNLQTVRTLLDYGADPHAHGRDAFDTALTLATREGHSRVVEHLLNRGVSNSSHFVVEALKAACLYGKHEILRILLARGVDVDAEFHQPRASIAAEGTSIFATALLRALENDDEKVVNDIADFRLQYDADINACSTVEGIHGVALRYALSYGEDFTVEFLLDNGADPSLVKTENLDEYEKRRLEDMLRNIQSKKRSLQVQEVETEETQADA